MTPRYPALTCPFPSAISPYAEIVEHATIAWAQQHGLVHGVAGAERIRRQMLSILTARSYPQAPLVALQWISDWTIWLFLLDDQWDEQEQGRAPTQIAQFQAALLAILRGGMPEQDDPLSQAWYDLATRLHAQVGAAWMRRFTQHLGDYFVACVWEATNRAERRIPDLATYLRMRLDTSAVYIYLGLIEFANQIELPAAVHAHPTVQGLARAANNLISWSNDIISIEKEQRHDDVHTLVIVLQQAQQCSLPQAISRAAALHNAEVQLFQRLLVQLPSFTPAVDANLQRYVMGLQFWIRGNLDWEYASDRYRPLVLDD